jgi:nitrate reductase gamma subunit
MNFVYTDLYDFLRGPGFVISVLVFTAGFIFRTVSLIRATRKVRRLIIKRDYNIRNNASAVKRNRYKQMISVIKTKLKNTIFTSNPVMGIVSLIFHILLFITPVFLSAHNIIADLTIGFSLPVLPERLTDIFTLVLMAIGGFLLARRIFIPRVRMISAARDYLILLFVMAPFVSGFLAYHHFFNYHVIIYLHMIIGEIAIMILPFTSLIHMPFIIFSRFYIDSEHSIIPGNRSW